MQTTIIQGEQVPILGFGTWRLKGEECRSSVAHALAVGYRHIDTAQNYGNEESVGSAITASGVARDSIFLTTKLSTSNVAADSVRPSVIDSLRKLQTDYVDLLLIHWPSVDVAPEETLEVMVSLQAAGLVRHIGVSNYPPLWVERAIRAATVFCNQVEYHPYLSQDDLRAMAVAHDHLLTAYSPLSRGRVLSDPTITEIAERHGADAGQVALRWLIQQDHVAAIPSSTSPAHMESNFAAQDIVLSDADMDRISALATGERIVDPPHAPDWER